MTAGERDPRVLSALGQGRMRNEKLPALAEALSGMRFGPQHAHAAASLLRSIDLLDAELRDLQERVGLVPVIVPAPPVMHALSAQATDDSLLSRRAAAGWGDAVVIVPWVLYERKILPWSTCSRPLTARARSSARCSTGTPPNCCTGPRPFSVTMTTRSGTGRGRSGSGRLSPMSTSTRRGTWRPRARAPTCWPWPC